MPKKVLAYRGLNGKVFIHSINTPVFETPKEALRAGDPRVRIIKNISEKGDIGAYRGWAYESQSPYKDPEWVKRGPLYTATLLDDGTLI